MTKRRNKKSSSSANHPSALGTSGKKKEKDTKKATSSSSKKDHASVTKTTCSLGRGLIVASIMVVLSGIVVFMYINCDEQVADDSQIRFRVIPRENVDNNELGKDKTDEVFGRLPSLVENESDAGPMEAKNDAVEDPNATADFERKAFHEPEPASSAKAASKLKENERETNEHKETNVNHEIPEIEHSIQENCKETQCAEKLKTSDKERRSADLGKDKQPDVVSMVDVVAISENEGRTTVGDDEQVSESKEKGFVGSESELREGLGKETKNAELVVETTEEEGALSGENGEIMTKNDDEQNNSKNYAVNSYQQESASSLDFIESRDSDLDKDRMKKTSSDPSGEKSTNKRAVEQSSAAMDDTESDSKSLQLENNKSLDSVALGENPQTSIKADSASEEELRQEQVSSGTSKTSGQNELSESEQTFDQTKGVEASVDHRLSVTDSENAEQASEARSVIGQDKQPDEHRDSENEDQGPVSSERVGISSPESGARDDKSSATFHDKIASADKTDASKATEEARGQPLSLDSDQKKTHERSPEVTEDAKMRSKNDFADSYNDDQNQSQTLFESFSALDDVVDDVESLASTSDNDEDEDDTGQSIVSEEHGTFLDDPPVHESDEESTKIDLELETSPKSEDDVMKTSKPHENSNSDDAVDEDRKLLSELGSDASSSENIVDNAAEDEEDDEQIDEDESFNEIVNSYGNTETESYHVEETRTKLNPQEDALYSEVTRGVRKLILRQGVGRPPKTGDVISFHCQGYLDSTPLKKFWSTKDVGQRPFSFAVGKKQVIRGWDEGIGSMKLLEKSKLKIESKKAYGKFGFEAWGIPPHTDLLLEVEVISIRRDHKM